MARRNSEGNSKIKREKSPWMLKQDGEYNRRCENRYRFYKEITDVTALKFFPTSQGIHQKINK